MATMFTPEERDRLRSELLEYGANDQRISSAAITGSAAAEREDCWSDIDLVFGVRDAGEVADVLRDWTALMYQQHRVLHHFDVRAAGWIYRVFLLPSTLQVDLAFVSAEDFRAFAPSFKLVFGEAKDPLHVPPPQAQDLIGLGWLYALHARSCIARGNLWQAEYMVSGIRDSALALACIRHGLTAVHGRGIDRLPSEVTAQFGDALVRQLDTAELSRALRVAVHGLLDEIHCADEGLAERLHEALISLIEAGAEKR